MYTIREEIKRYYDEATVLKLKDFAFGNRRIEKAWETILQHNSYPKRILEIGCGIGTISHRMNQTWPDSQIIGIDISERSIEIANALFKSNNCQFSTNIPNEFIDKNAFDLIILIDVIEHVEEQQRPELVEMIRKNLDKEGVLLLTFPTPHMLNINRTQFPERLQPVEEDIDLSVLKSIAESIKRPIVLYKEVNIWEKRDYGHAILSNSLHESKQNTQPFKELFKKKLRSKIKKNKEISLKNQRAKLIWSKLKIDILEE